MSAERYLDLMEGCKLDLPRIRAEQGSERLTEGERMKVEKLRALVVGFQSCPQHGLDIREILWPSGATQIVASRYLLPAKLTE